ncbi:MAG: arginine--tRNA ligase [Desulfobacterales bacterium]|nr:arginine--tRNA ligase [Desulfobacterales bacterium]
MKHRLQDIILAAASAAYQAGELPSDAFPAVLVEEPKQDAHGDFSTNLAMTMAKIQKMAPRKIADILLSHVSDVDGIIEKTEIAGPGFINFYLHAAAWHPVVHKVHREGDGYGACNIGNGERVQVEFVSSNPTGPLHVGHGRGAVVGDSVASILSFCGYDVQREYYINDSGRQIQTLGRSVLLRYREHLGQTVDFPEECYQGDYIADYAVQVADLKGDLLLSEPEEEAVLFCARHAAGRIVDQMRQALVDFGVTFDNWFSEQSLYDAGKVAAAIDDMIARGLVYEKDGAQWFRTTDFGDEKDRVVVRNNGQTTYFASDIAYHQDKFQRGFTRCIDVWGADHHGYIPRVTAAIEASGYARDRFQVILVQLVNLLRGGEPVAMSTRAGEFVTLEDVMAEVGTDAARFIFLTRHYDSPLDFDLDLAKKKTNENPVYYVQYVHARISSIMRKAAEMGVTLAEEAEPETVSCLTATEEIQLIKHLARYPEVVRTSAETMEPHRITFYLMALAAAFHAYYNKHRVLGEDPRLTAGRLYLILAVQKVIRNGLRLLGVSAPEKM